ncbi:hypothetical protein D9M69_400960 [compost metagenome]
MLLQQRQDVPFDAECAIELLGQIVEERQPRPIQVIGQKHLLFENVAGDFQAVDAVLKTAAQCRCKLVILLQHLVLVA